MILNSNKSVVIFANYSNIKSIILVNETIRIALKKNKINTEHFSLDKLIIWDIDSKYVKVGAARLIELIKKDLIEDKNINIYDKHALVLTTNSKISQDSILDYANQIKSKVLEVFNISLEIEPTIISN